MASVEDDLTVTCSRKVRLVADRSIKECTGETFDLIALPVSVGASGMGVEVARLQGGAQYNVPKGVFVRGHLAVSYC